MHSIQWHQKKLKYLLPFLKSVKERHAGLVDRASQAYRSSKDLITLHRYCNALVYIIIKTLLQKISLADAREVKLIRKELREHPVSSPKVRPPAPKVTEPVYSKVLPRRILTGGMYG